MPNLVLPLTVLLALAPAASAEMGPFDRVELAQLSIHQRIVIRIPRVFGRRAEERSEFAEQRWVTKKGPKCVPMGAIEGAVITGSDSVDLLVADGTRLRAEFDDDCPALDFYSGLYVKGTSDGMVCADRDSIRSRSGSACKIERFRRLVAKR
ncbi:MULTISPECIES: hypothetical protein [Sphingomonas]|uniref:DUF3617 family protein n=1 Tax=Sphingomonas glacialis TaxID=658225 RepID=A0ABQ3LPX1_9SPHN|nr:MULTISPECIES: hypothetical protein [Sphingomonas]MDY7523357.1 hypothetical protein [Sphingomonas sp. 10B4]MEB0281055.1 hypothetical protein [Sphingomonas sp. 10B4]GHH22884.1 hypothetical protein GCM10008023_33460 [Sphingomonas glacialis]